MPWNKRTSWLIVSECKTFIFPNVETLVNNIFDFPKDYPLGIEGIKQHD